MSRCDICGRGPMFGRVYCAAVILPKDDSFQHNLMKDSKKFHSKKKNKCISSHLYQPLTKQEVLRLDHSTDLFPQEIFYFYQL